MWVKDKVKANKKCSIIYDVLYVYEFVHLLSNLGLVPHCSL